MRIEKRGRVVTECPARDGHLQPGVLGANAATLEQLVHMRLTAITLSGEERFTWSAAGVGYPTSSTWRPPR